MGEDVKTLYGMNGNIVVVVHVKDLKDGPNKFVVKLPFRPCIGDWINLEGQELKWEDIEVPKIIPAIVSGACSAIHVEDVVIYCDVERNECVVHVYGPTGVDPMHRNK